MKFQKLILENIYSHKKTEFDLDNRGLSLIVGDNGAGKSSIIKSILFCLFNIGADSVVNKTIGENTCVTLIGEGFTVRRYRKHKKHKNNLHFFIDDKPVKASTNTELQQKMEKFIGLDYRSFLNVAAFSSDMLMFCSATDVERKAIFERILQDLDVYNDYYQQTREEQQALKVSIDELKHNIEIEEREVSVVKKVVEVEKKRGLELEVRRQQELDELREELSELKVKFDTCLKFRDKRLRIQRAVGQLDGWLDEHPFDNATFFRTEQQLHDAQHKLTKGIHQDNCSECNQPITEEHRTSEKIRLQELIAIITDVLIEFEIRKDIRQKVTDKFNELNERSESLRYKLTKYEGLQGKIKEVRRKIEKVEGEIDSSVEVIKHWASKIKQLSKKISSYTRKIKKQEEMLIYLDEVIVGFSKQGIPNVIIARALHHLEERANHYLDILTTGAIGVRLSGFSLTKKGGVRNKIGIEVISANEVTDFDNYSGGEQQRLNIALLLALRDVAEFNRGVRLNILLLDEVLDRSLDKVGAEAVLELLFFLRNKIDSIFVFTPKSELLNDLNISFDNKVVIEKVNGFSTLR